MDVEPIKIGNDVLEGRNNAHLVRSGSEAALVDTASAGTDSRRRLKTALEERLGSVEAVDYVVLTHFHPDHSGLAGSIQADSGAEILIHGLDADRLHNPNRGTDTQREADQFGLPASVRRSIPDGGFADMLTDWDELTEVSDGDVVSVGDVDLEVTHTPGHTAGSIVLDYATERGRAAFVGDTLLPEYTPNIGTDRRIDDHLQAYLSVLRELIDADYATAWPGHGERLTAPAQRAARIIDHHRQRSRRVLDALDEDRPERVWAVTTALFDDLEGVHVHLAVSEVFAHLEHLADAGAVAHEDDGYVLVDNSRSIEDLVTARPAE